ncbi:O-antigen ligase family protein [Desulfitobacterium sp. Sab5]|uniref:O-antigen ligase family protein n=1 Tax=Desulfitobacterium nosdiversum TaxID=3375356 RepID=UPI003CFA48D9
MTGITLNRVNRAGDSKVRSLAFVLMVSIIFAHGVFFPEQWLLIGAGLAFLQCWGVFKLKDISGLLSLTDGLFLALISCSLLGLLHPVKSSEGWMDALRWFTLWMIYRQARWIQGEENQQRMLNWIQAAGIMLAVLAWLPQLSLWAKGSRLFTMGLERLSSSVGYPNALGVYLAAVILLSPRLRIIQVLLFLTLLNTGSRASLVLFLLIMTGREIVKRRRSQQLRDSFIGIESKSLVKKPKREKLLFGVISISASLLSLIYVKGPSQHLLDWGIRNSLGERLLYFQDGIKLAWLYRGIPQAGGWFTFPLVQHIPYWTTDPHSLLIRVLLDQGIYGMLILSLWAILMMKRLIQNSKGRQFYIFGALLFLMLHALMDTDFLFGTLGILFWTLIGMSVPYEDKKHKKLNLIPLKHTQNRMIKFMPEYHNVLKKFLPGAIYLFLGLLLLGAGIYLPRTDSLKVAEQEAKNTGDKQYTLSVLKKSLHNDQIQFSIRREIARLELELQGADALGAMENVLAWEKFNIRTYEWAQGFVLEEAEKRRKTNPREADILYQWSKELPSRLIKVSSVNRLERMLWPGAANFQPSEMMRFLKSTAEERQLTLR